MNYEIVEKNNKKYINCGSEQIQIETEKDAIELISVCMENDIFCLMLHAEALSDDFFRLRTGLAGAVLQKFINYHIKAAAIIPKDIKIKGRFNEFASEANKGNDFRVFSSVNEAEGWLLS